MGDLRDELLDFLEGQRSTPGAVLEAGVTAHPGLVRLLDKRLEIKARHPKP